MARKNQLQAYFTHIWSFIAAKFNVSLQLVGKMLSSPKSVRKDNIVIGLITI